MDDDELDELLRRTARDYNAPPETPRDEMWRAIHARRRRTRVRSISPRRWIPWAAAAAAVLALGVGLGRLSVRNAPRPVPAPVAIRTSPRSSATAYRLAAAEHLGQSEAFLTLFRASIRPGGDERLASATARELLTTNRLLLDSPAMQDRRTRLLLEDLELVLAEIAQLTPEPRDRDLKLIREGIERDGMLPRLRTAVPAGATQTQGAL
ncbi:MAG: hypothetical protein ACJ8DC_09290 [Gemmatimonadales bacterium]